MNNKSSMIRIAFVGMLLVASSLFAQPVSVPSSGGDTTNGSNPVTAPVSSGGSDSVAPKALGALDLSSITNFPKLVSDEFKKVKSILVNVSATADVHGYPQSTYYTFTNEVKTLEDAMGMITNTYYGFELVDTNTSTISLNIQFYDMDNENAVRNGIKDSNGKAPMVIFQGSNGGTPLRNQYGGFMLPDYAQSIQMNLAYDFYISATNVGTARLLYTNVNGQWFSMDLPVDWGKGFSFPGNFAGQGILYLAFWTLGADGYYRFSEHAYSLANNGAEVQLIWAYARAMITDSDTIKTSVNQTNLAYDVYSYQGFGKVPLLTPTYTTTPPNSTTNRVYLSVYSSQLGTNPGWRPIVPNATAFRIENLETKEVSIVNVPQNPDGTYAQGVYAGFKKGRYHVAPLGLNLLPWEMYSYYYGGGKG